MSNFFGHYAEFGLILFLCMKWVLFFKPFCSIIDWDSVQNSQIFGTCSFIKTNIFLTHGHGGAHLHETCIVEHL